MQILVGAAFVWAASRGFDLDGRDESPQAAVRSAASTDRFDERRAWRLLREQVDRFGPRPAGSPASRRLAVRLRGLLPRGRFESLGPPAGGREADVGGSPVRRRLRNVVGVVPGARPAVVIGAHYDTEARPRGHVGANDGAAGTAAVVELSRALARTRRPAGSPELRFVLFDGEEEPAGCNDFARCGLRGSRAYARRHAREVGAMVLLDYIAEKGTRIPREAGSDPELWERLRAASRAVGVPEVFPPETAQAILDDHIPFLEAGIPAIDLIDFDYPHRDTLRDTPDKLSTRSLDAVGETVAELVLGLRADALG